MFSKNFLISTLRPSFEQRFSSFLKLTGFRTRHQRALSLQDVYDSVYGTLRKSYRCEYVYKNIIAEQLLLNKHPLHEACLFTEMLTRDSRADAVIVNGTTTCYEIKTELDSLFRVQRQVEANKKVFDRLYIVTYPAFVDRIEKSVERRVGIISLDDNLNLTTVRESYSNLGDLSPEYIFSQLRANEVVETIEIEFGKQPKVQLTNFQQYYYALFASLPISVIHGHFVRILVGRRCKTGIQEDATRATLSLKSIFLSHDFSRKRSALIFERLRTLRFN
jgi:hypothetical protein